MSRNNSEVLLLDPITTKKERMKVDDLVDILCCSRSYILNTRRIRGFNKKINMFLLPIDIKSSEIEEILRNFKPYDEIWLDCKGLKKGIKVSNYGRIAHFKLNGNIKIYQLTTNKSGNRMVTRITLDNGKRKEVSPARYVATMFLNGGKLLPEDSMVVHKNRIKWDNRVSNLEILKRKESAKYGVLSRSNKYVAKVNPWTKEIVDVYVSYNEAGRQNNISGTCISESVKSNSELIYGRFQWAEITEEEYYDLKELLIS